MQEYLLENEDKILLPPMPNATLWHLINNGIA